jgi:CubicO group peptidase (beta-lactamase class C family)
MIQKDWFRAEVIRIVGIGILFFLMLFCTGCDAAKMLTKKRIKTTENGLLKAVVFQGQEPERMKLAERMAYYQVPGVSIAAVDNYAIEWARGYGIVYVHSTEPVTTESLFQAGELSQPVAAAGALSLAGQGTIDLDADVNDYLQSWKISGNRLGGEVQVTLRRMISHSAGLIALHYEGVESIEDTPSLDQILRGEQTGYPPVLIDRVHLSELNYSDAHFAVLERVLEDVEGKPFPEFIAQSVFSPLGMEHSSFAQTLPEFLFDEAATGHDREGNPIAGKGYIYPVTSAKGLWTTPSDLALFAIDLMQTALGQTQKILTPDLARHMLSFQSGNRGLGLRLDDAGDNLHFYLRGRSKGFTCFMVAYPVKGQGVVIMANSENGEELIDEILRAVSEAYKWPHFIPEVKKLFRLDPSIYKLYEGRYEVNPDYHLTVTHEDYYLVIQPTGQVPTKFYVESTATFFSTDPYIRIRFVRDAEGRVTGLVLRQRDFRLEAKKIE